MLQEVLNQLSKRELAALDKATSALYFGDSSDYCTALWNVIDALIGDEINLNEVEPEMLYRELSKDNKLKKY